MGASGHPTGRMDYLLLLYLEGGQMDRKSGVLYGPVPLLPPNCPADSRHHPARCHRWNQVLCYSEFLQDHRVRGM